MAVSKEYEKMMLEKEVFVLPDVYPWSGVHLVDTSLVDGIVTSVSSNTGSSIGTAEIKFPKKTFGDHVVGITPVKICVDKSDNIVFRGFITEETGVLSETDDTITVKAMDYKWYFSKCTRIRGKFFTTGEATPTPYGGPNSIGDTKLKYEMFRAPVIRDDGEAGYLQSEPTVFNENGLPTCLIDGVDGNRCIFKSRKMYTTDGVQYIQDYNYGAKYWTYSSILAHIVFYWLDPYGGITSPIKISPNSYAELSRLKEDEASPFDLSIEGLNPLDAINEVVSLIPGKWIWYLTYVGATTFINLMNLNNLANLAGAKKFIAGGDGDGGNPKQASATGGTGGGAGTANVSEISVVRNYENASNYLVLKGGKLKLTTTVELQPAFPMYTWDAGPVGNQTSVTVPFTNASDYKAFKTWITSTNVPLLSATLLRYKRAYRYYCIPKEGELLAKALENVTFKSSIPLTGRLKTMYSGIETDLKKMFAHGVNINREYGAPCHPEFKEPVVFAYDPYMYWSNTLKTNISEQRKIVYFDGGYSFDTDNGLIIFEKPQFCRFATGDATGDLEPVKPESDKGGNKKVTNAEVSNFPDSLVDIDNMVSSASMWGTTCRKSLISRRIFCTLSITVDIPYLVGDNIFGINYSDGGNFTRYVDFDGNDLIIHANAMYPVVPNSKVEIDLTKRVAYTIANEGDTLNEYACPITENLAYYVLYTAESMKLYEKFPKKSDMILLQKLDNLKKSINAFDETVTVNLGVLDTLYKVGDIITSIENVDGYKAMLNYINQVSITLEGDTKGYSTTVTATNNVEFSPKNFDKMMEKEVKRPNILRGTYQSNDYFEKAVDET